MQKIIIGKLKRTLSEKCPVCLSPLQIRIIEKEQLIRGNISSYDEEIICCSLCDYEREVKDKKKRKNRIDKTAISMEDAYKDDRYNKRNPINKNNGNSSREGFRRNNKRSS